MKRVSWERVSSRHLHEKSKHQGGGGGEESFCLPLHVFLSPSCLWEKAGTIHCPLPILAAVAYKGCPSPEEHRKQSSVFHVHVCILSLFLTATWYGHGFLNWTCTLSMTFIIITLNCNVSHSISTTIILANRAEYPLSPTRSLAELAKIRGFSARLSRIIVLLFNKMITKHSFIAESWRRSLFCYLSSIS